MQASTLSDLLDTALELAPAQRAAWIDSLGEEHASLKPRLRALLARAATGGATKPADWESDG